jgi:allophanate hydrolase
VTSTQFNRPAGLAEAPPELSLDIGTLRAAYRAKELTPSTLVEVLLSRLEHDQRPEAWITLVPAERLRADAAALQTQDMERLPLFGIPFAVKDNIDVVGLPTTAACPGFARVPTHTATVVQHLLDAGALLLGKTNLDQFATGLNGTRSPYGAVRNSFDEQLISGGSSSGSAVVVATGLVTFALGTDTAGSGRVPAAFNNLIGLKPTRGLLSTFGVLPACRSLDCVSIIGLGADDAERVLDVMAKVDPLDAFSRSVPMDTVRVPGRIAGTRFGVPRTAQLEFFGDELAAAAFEQTTEVIRAEGGEFIEIDYEPFDEAARLLYDGPWVAERAVAVMRMLGVDTQALDPCVRSIVERGNEPSASDAFVAFYRLRELKQQIEKQWQAFDLLMTPTTPTIYSIDAMRADPIQLNTNLGYYTNFVNLFDLSAIAVPGRWRDDGLPSGFTLCAPAFAESTLTRLAAELHPLMVDTAGATGLPLPLPVEHQQTVDTELQQIEIMVCGAHMSGLPLNHELTAHGATFLRRARTEALYRLHALEAFEPPRPALVRVINSRSCEQDVGHHIEVEVWSMPAIGFGRFVARIPHPLCIGTVALDDGRHVSGFLCEAYAADAAPDISVLGGWRAYVEQRAGGMMNSTADT